MGFGTLTRGEIFRQLYSSNSVFDDILSNQPGGVAPEDKLALAVINRAIRDLTASHKWMRKDARRFIMCQDFEVWCELAGVGPIILREYLIRMGLLR